VCKLRARGLLNRRTAPQQLWSQHSPVIHKVPARLQQLLHEQVDGCSAWHWVWVKDALLLEDADQVVIGVWHIEVEGAGEQDGLLGVQDEVAQLGHERLTMQQPSSAAAPPY
jgi:hypothetical protein